MSLKKCSNCGQTKDESEFYRNHYWCKDCDREYSRNYTRKLRKTPEGKKKLREHQRKTYRKHKKEYLARNKKWFDKHPNYEVKRHQKWKIKLVKMFGGKCHNPHCSTPNGYNRSVAALEFHHVDETEKEGRLRPYIKKHRELLIKLWEERKIILLCSNCHAEEHEKHTEYRTKSEGF